MPSCTLKKIPKEVYDFLIDVQGEIKKTRQINQYSLESTIYKIINDSRKCIEENMKNEKENEPGK